MSQIRKLFGTTVCFWESWSHTRHLRALLVITNNVETQEKFVKKEPGFTEYKHDCSQLSIWRKEKLFSARSNKAPAFGLATAAAAFVVWNKNWHSFWSHTKIHTQAAAARVVIHFYFVPSLWLCVRESWNNFLERRRNLLKTPPNVRGAAPGLENAFFFFFGLALEYSFSHHFFEPFIEWSWDRPEHLSSLFQEHSVPRRIKEEVCSSDKEHGARNDVSALRRGELFSSLDRSSDRN